MKKWKKILIVLFNICIIFTGCSTDKSGGGYYAEMVLQL